MTPIHSHRFPSLRPACLAAALATAAFGIPASLHANVVLGGGGLVLAEEGGTFAADNLSTLSGTAFALDVLPAGTHSIAGVNDGIYGNATSWIGNSANSWVGVGFNAPQNIQSIAFGRSNVTSGDPCPGGVCTDRVLGVYTLQYTLNSNVLAAPETATWVTIGTLDYQSAGGPNFASPHLRHRYNFDEIMDMGMPADVYGVRLIAPTGAAIDEIELYSSAGMIVPPLPGLVTTSVPGFSVTWDGNDGDFFNPGVPATVPLNLAQGGTAFATAELGGPHVTGALNDGLYGNSNSWIGGPANAQAGILLGGLYNLTSLAFGRDNGNGAFDDDPLNPGTDACGGQCDDRFAGLYTLEITTDEMTWTTIGSVEILFNEDTVPGGGVTGYFRHEFDIALAGGGAIMASGVRITGSTAGIAIDEIEIYGTPVPEPGSIALLALGALGFLGRRRR